MRVNFLAVRIDVPEIVMTSITFLIVVLPELLPMVFPMVLTSVLLLAMVHARNVSDPLLVMISANVKHANTSIAMTVAFVKCHLQRNKINKAQELHKTSGH